MRFNEIGVNIEDDKYGTWEIDDTRRPKLTLKHLNKIRKRREIAKAEHAQMVQDFQPMYSKSSEE